MSSALQSDTVRMWDLVRYQRYALHEDGLITDEEFTALVEDVGPGHSPRRLESYDELRARLTATQQTLARVKHEQDALVVKWRKSHEDKEIEGNHGFFHAGVHYCADQLAAISEPSK